MQDENCQDSETTEDYLPIYNCHKQVGALKIESIFYNADGSIYLNFINHEYKEILKSHEWYMKYMPIIGGYYVVYKGGYSAWSPADAFEDGYTPHVEPVCDSVDELPSMTVRCKFVVTSEPSKDSNGGCYVNLSPVTSGSPENEKFWDYTPAGSLNLYVSNDSLDHFKVGDEYYIDIIPALNPAPLYPDSKEEMEVISETVGEEISEPLVDMDKEDPQFTENAGE